jgi:Short C-terminal domain
VLALGVFALGARKKRDDRQLYIVVEGNGWAVTETLKPKLEGRARAFAAQVNALAGGQPSADPSALDALQKLGNLRDQGILTVDEFEAKKTELLDRI